MNNREKSKIMHSLDRAKNGDLLLNPDACCEWIPTQYEDKVTSPFEEWATAFDEIIIGTEYGRSRSMSKKLLAEYFKGLKAYQLRFWIEHKDKIKATIDSELLNEYDDDNEAGDPEQAS